MKVELLNFFGIVFIIAANNLRDRLLQSNKDHFVFLAYCASTFFHELSHFIASLITFGKPTSFSLLPKKIQQEDRTLWILGSVGSSNVNFINAPIIGLAPFSLLGVAFFVWNEFFRYFEINIFSVFSFYLILYLLISNSLPSMQDYRVAFEKWYFTIPFYSLIFAIIYYQFLRSF